MIYNKPFSNFVIYELSHRIEVLNGLSDTFFYIAGGAIRDILNGKQIKDIDVFYAGEFSSSILDGFAAIPIANDNYPEGLTKCTHKGKWGNYDLDFIKINDESHINEVVEAFPCSLSQVYVSCIVPNRYFYSSWYNNSVDAHNLYFDHGCPEEYHDRIVTKYPDWNVVMTDLTGAFWNNNTINDSNSLSYTVFHTNPLLDSIIPKQKVKVKAMKKYKIINTDKKGLYRESADESW